MQSINIESTVNVIRKADTRLLVTDSLAPKPFAIVQQTDSPQPFYQEANKALRFVDSVSVRFEKCLAEPTCGGALRARMDEKDRNFKLWQYIGQLETLSGIKVFIRYLPGSKEMPAYVTLALSIPKVVQGNNFALISPRKDIIAILNTELEPVYQRIGISPETFIQGEIRRIDFALNFPVGKDVSRYLSNVRNRTYPNRERCDYNNTQNRPAGVDKQNNGVSFYSRAGQTIFYDKERECKNQLAAGILRMETSYREAKAIQRLFHKKQPSLLDLTTNLCQKVLHKDLTILRLNDPIVCVKDLRDELRKHFSASVTNHLMGFVDLERKYPGLTPKELAEVSGLSEGTIRASRRKLRKAGISYLDDEETSLPALTLDALDDTLTLAESGGGCGEIDAGNDKNRTHVPCNTPETLGQTVILTPASIPSPEESEELLASALFGKPTILVAPPKLANAGDGADPDYDDILEDLHTGSGESDSLDQCSPDLPPAWLDLHDYITAHFLGRNVQAPDPWSFLKKPGRDGKMKTGR